MVITGNERAFSAGADITEMADASAVDIVNSGMVDRWNKLRGIMDRTGVEHVVVTSIPDYLPFPKNWGFKFTKGRKIKSGGARGAKKSTAARAPTAQ